MEEERCDYLVSSNYQVIDFKKELFNKSSSGILVSTKVMNFTKEVIFSDNGITDQPLALEMDQTYCDGFISNIHQPKQVIIEILNGKLEMNPNKSQWIQGIKIIIDIAVLKQHPVYVSEIDTYFYTEELKETFKHPNRMNTLQVQAEKSASQIEFGGLVCYVRTRNPSINKVWIEAMGLLQEVPVIHDPNADDTLELCVSTLYGSTSNNSKSYTLDGKFGYYLNDDNEVIFTFSHAPTEMFKAQEQLKEHRGDVYTKAHLQRLEQRYKEAQVQLEHEFEIKLNDKDLINAELKRNLETAKQEIGTLKQHIFQLESMLELQKMQLTVKREEDKHQFDKERRSAMTESARYSADKAHHSSTKEQLGVIVAIIGIATLLIKLW